MTHTLTQVATCERLRILAPFEGVCFGHALCKAHQYATSNEGPSMIGVSPLK